MLGELVASDLDFEGIAECLPYQTSWGKAGFKAGLDAVSTDTTEIKRKQIITMTLFTEQKLNNQVREKLKTINTASIEDTLYPKDDIQTESVGQILWKPNNVGSFLNSSPLVLNALIMWKTIFLPLFAILMPLCALIIPYFVLQYYNSDLNSTAYVEHMRTVILAQISVPSVLKSKNADDRLGFILESLFIGGTLAMYISSLWNQIAAALHLRNLWASVEERGSEIQTLRNVTYDILQLYKTLPVKKQRALRYFLDSGDAALKASNAIENLNGVATYGTVWNGEKGVKELKAWITRLDVYTSIASLPDICFPKMIMGTEPYLAVSEVYHPAIHPCVSNNFTSSAHTLLTGPNRGGKSTFCKALGIAVITAQSWGFAWAKRMTWTPFRRILTSLEHAGILGRYSTFEAEIEFAKDVLAEPAAPLFVIMDEIFHSTNAGDGVAASKVFMDRLYNKSGVISLISTHYKELVTGYTDITQTLQMVATNGTNGKLDYTYKTAPGISDKSSVLEILEERGLRSVS